ncbi:hypothetical protein [uncultured Prevotella sp.]|uniref:hypothetical protein n=1 Tax=uncultured Prevotella sp. TaxID=159272 RepID=UPI0027E3295C|nr:hypothetical protein [uncultured Prevotella sp.]
MSIRVLLEGENSNFKEEEPLATVNVAVLLAPSFVKAERATLVPLTFIDDNPSLFVYKERENSPEQPFKSFIVTVQVSLGFFLA